MHKRVIFKIIFPQQQIDVHTYNKQHVQLFPDRFRYIDSHFIKLQSLIYLTDTAIGLILLNKLKVSR